MNPELNDFAATDAASHEDKTRRDATVAAALDLHFGLPLDPATVSTVSIVDHFSPALAAPDPLPSFALGLRALGVGLVRGVLHEASSQDLSALRSAIYAASGPAIEATGGQFSAMRFMTGVGAAVGLFQQIQGARESDDLIRDRLDHLLGLADELDALVRRRRIEARGDLVRRLGRLALAREVTRTDEPLN